MPTSLHAASGMPQDGRPGGATRMFAAETAAHFIAAKRQKR